MPSTFVRAIWRTLAGSSGVGVLSGWVCDADMVEIELNGVPQEAAYGTERLDTAGCVAMWITALGCWSTGIGWERGNIRVA